MNVTKNNNSGRLLVLDVKNASIISFNTDGNDMRTVRDKLVGTPDGIAVDPVKKHIYWTSMGVKHDGERFDENDGSIERIDFDGSNHVTIIPQGGTFTPKQLQLDTKNGFIYWSDREGMRVMRSKLDGSEITTLIQAGEGDTDRQDETRHCVGIAIDTENNHLYWTQKGPPNGGKGRIFRAGLQLPPDTDAAQRKDVELLWENLPEPIDLDIDYLNGMIYWTDRGDGPMGNTLNRGAIRDQVSPYHEILCSGLKEGIGLALDPINDRIYFGDLYGHVYRCNLNGFDRREIYAGVNFFTGITYVPGGLNN